MGSGTHSVPTLHTAHPLLPPATPTLSSSLYCIGFGLVWAGIYNPHLPPTACPPTCVRCVKKSDRCAAAAAAAAPGPAACVRASAMSASSSRRPSATASDSQRQYWSRGSLCVCVCVWGGGYIHDELRGGDTFMIKQEVKA